MTDETANSRSAKEAGAAGATGEASAPVTDAPQPRPAENGPAGGAPAPAGAPTASAGTAKTPAGGASLRPEQERPDTAADVPDEAPAATGGATGATVLRPGAPLPGAAEETEDGPEADAGDGSGEPADDGAAAADDGAKAASVAAGAEPAAAGAAAGKKASAGRRGLGLFRRADAVAGAAGAGAKAESGNRVSPGVVAGAALAGVVLLGAPFAISALSKGFAASPANAAGDLTQPLPDAGSDGGKGFVPVPGGVRNDGGTAPRTDGQAPAGSGNAPAGNGDSGAGSGPHTDGDATRRTDPTAGSADHGDKAGADDKGGSEAHARTLATRTFTAFAGPTCANGAGASYHEIGAYGDGKEGWLTRTGGSTAGGCGGGVRSMPMSGDADSPDSDVTSYWQFNSGMKSASCRISVYIPQGKSPVEVGGAPARYSVHKGTKWYGGDLAGFHIDQPRNKGSWVLGTTVHVEGGRFTLRVTNAGQDWEGDTSTLAHVAAAQVKAECRAE